VVVTVTSDTTPPEVLHAPVRSAQAGRPIVIEAQVTDPSGVKWVRVLYRDVNQKLDYQALPMTPTATKDHYQTTVPAKAISPQWDFMYLIEVMDNKGNGRIYPDLEKETPYIVVRVQQLQGG
jgi:hypothetical protein